MLNTLNKHQETKCYCYFCSIVDIVTVSPLGLTKSSVTASTTSRLWFVNITWTPTLSQSGPNVFCYYAVDSVGWVILSLRFFVSMLNLERKYLNSTTSSLWAKRTNCTLNSILNDCYFFQHSLSSSQSCIILLGGGKPMFAITILYECIFKIIFGAHLLMLVYMCVLSA